MRLSRGFGETLRRSPAGVDDPALQVLLRAGYIRETGPGLISYLPTGRRSLGIGGLEISLPFVQPQEIWRRSGTLGRAGEELARLADRSGRPLVLSTSNEEAAAELVRSEVGSYRQLPVTLFQIRRVFRDEERPRAGPLRAREFTLLDSYSFARDAAELAEIHQAHLDAFRWILARVGLQDTLLVGAGPASPDSASDQEFFYPLASGDDRVLGCDACGYAEKAQRARFARPEPSDEAAAPLEKVVTPGSETIAALADYLSVPVERTAKVVFFSAARDSKEDTAESRRILLMAVVRGDMEVSEAKLRDATATYDLQAADADQIRSVGAEPGYASPVGLDSEGMIVCVDDLVARSPNLIAGANEEGRHLRNINFERDCRADVIADIALAPIGAPCVACGSPLRSETGVEVASLHRFPIGWGERLRLAYQDEHGTQSVPRMASFGMGLDRLLACAAAVHRDDQGLRLPAAIAPFQVTLVSIPGGDAGIEAQADALYTTLQEAGFTVLYDDREVSPGVKFNDADLVGIPVRLTLGARSLERGGVEWKQRDAEGQSIVPIDELVATLRRQLTDPS